jgi:hypothetical protein
MVSLFQPSNIDYTLADLEGTWEHQGSPALSDSIVLQIDSAGGLRGFNFSSRCSCRAQLQQNEDLNDFFGNGTFDALSVHWKMRWLAHNDTLFARLYHQPLDPDTLICQLVLASPPG